MAKGLVFLGGAIVFALGCGSGGPTGEAESDLERPVANYKAAYLLFEDTFDGTSLSADWDTSASAVNATWEVSGGVLRTTSNPSLTENSFSADCIATGSDTWGEIRVESEFMVEVDTLDDIRFGFRKGLNGEVENKWYVNRNKGQTSGGVESAGTRFQKSGDPVGDVDVQWLDTVYHLPINYIIPDTWYLYRMDVIGGWGQTELFLYICPVADGPIDPGSDLMYHAIDDAADEVYTDPDNLMETLYATTWGVPCREGLTTIGSECESSGSGHANWESYSVYQLEAADGALGVDEIASTPPHRLFASLFRNLPVCNWLEVTQP